MELTPEWKLYTALQDLHSQYHNNTKKEIEEYVKLNRLYPDGFKFYYYATGSNVPQIAEITGVLCSLSYDIVDDGLSRDQILDIDPDEDIYIGYSCYVPSICDNPLWDGTVIGNNPNKGVYVPEAYITKNLIPETFISEFRE